MKERATTRMSGSRHEGNETKPRFWRRLAAIWVDLFVIYGAATMLIALAAAVPVRVSFEPAYWLSGVVYSNAMLLCCGTTIGKALLGIAVVVQDGRCPGFQHVLIRELVGKWGIGIALPVILGRAILDHAWMPTVYDFLLLAPWLAMLFLHYVITRRTWYDRLAGTAVMRMPQTGRRANPAFAALLAAAVVVTGLKWRDAAEHGRLPCRLAVYHGMRPMAPYKTFLAQGHENPVDYLLKLFDRYDVVVLCERMHPESTQWEFIFDVVRDPRFSESVGHVFTEYGHVGMQGYMDEFMAADGLSPEEVHRRAVHIMRNWAVWPTWWNTNFYTYLNRLYELNQSLPPARRIRHYFTDAPVEWEDLKTAGDYRAYKLSLVNRDEQMARNVIAEMDRLRASAERPPKCLVVMNYRHAFDLTGGSPAARRINTYEYLRDAFGGRAANVLLSTDMILVPLAGGIWDAAFAEAGHPAIGFDLAGSPFGTDAFDMFPFDPTIRKRLRYQDVFTGMVYDNPPDERYREVGIPGYYRDFEEEALRRWRLLGEARTGSVEIAIQQDKEGGWPSRDSLPLRRVETMVELLLMALAGVGLTIGSISFAVGRIVQVNSAKRRRDPDIHTA